MNGDFGGLGYRLLVYVIGGAVLLGVLKGAGLALDILPVSRSRRLALRRAAPLLGAVLVVGYCLLVVRSLFGEQPGMLPVALAMILGGFVAASWGPLKDVVAGVFLKAGRICNIGDVVQVADVNGRVTEMGHRALTVETSSGEHVVVPYGMVASGAVFKVPDLSGAQAHVFELTLAPELEVPDAVRRLQGTAMLHHWSSIVKVPEVKLLRGRTCRVTLYPLALDYAPAIEEQLRREFSA